MSVIEVFGDVLYSKKSVRGVVVADVVVSPSGVIFCLLK